jgi:PTH1 family peptidyl-tRNA hydrolase
MTRLVIGLGNQGPEYAHTRHNAGFLVVDLLAENLGASYWKDEAGAKTAKVRLGEVEIVLAKPQTFMNVSGTSVKRWV